MSKIDISYRRIAIVTSPVVVSQLTYTAMGVIDTMMVGRLGLTALAGVGLGNLLTWWFLSFFLGLLQGVNTFVAQSFGAERRREVGASVWQGLALGGASALFIAAVYPLAPTVFSWTGAEANVQVVATEYSQIRLLGASGFILLLVAENFYRGLGKTHVPMLAGIAQLVVNCGLNYLFIFGKFGFPELGPQGAALGTVLAQLLTGGCLMTSVLVSRYGAKYWVRRPTFRPRLLMKMLKVSWPIGIQVFMEMGGISVFTAVVARLGEAQMAVTNAVIQAWSLGFMIAVALAVGATTLVGQCLGARQAEDARLVVRRVMRIGYAAMALTAVLFVGWPNQIIELFVTQADLATVLPYVRPLFIIAVICLVFDLQFNVYSGALRGAGDTTYSMLVNIGSAWLVFVPLVLWATPRWGVIGAWSCFIVHVMVMGLLLGLRIRGRRWIEKGLVLAADDTMSESPAGEPELEPAVS